MQLEQQKPPAYVDPQKGPPRKRPWLQRPAMPRMTRASLNAIKKRMLERYGFLKGQYLRAFAWPIFCTAAAVAAVRTVESGHRAERREVEARAIEEADVANRAYSQQIRSTVENFSQTLSMLKYMIEADQGPGNVYDKARATVLPLIGSGVLPAVDKIRLIIVDRDGNMRTLSSRNSSSVNVSASDFYKGMRALRRNEMQIVAGQGLLLKLPVVRFSRPLYDRENRFDGIVELALMPEYLTSFYDPTRMSRIDYLAVVDSTNKVIAATSRTGHDTENGIAPEFTGLQGAARVAGGAFSDHSSRIVAWDSIPVFGLRTMVAMNDDAIFEEANANIRREHRLLAIAVLFMLASGIGGTIVILRRMELAHHTEQTRNSFRTANELAWEGFFTLEPIYDDDKNVVDFIYTDCNQPGATFLGRSASDVRGARVTQIYPPSVSGKVLQLLRDVMEKEFVDDSYQVPAGSPLLLDWVHVRAVRQGRCIAVTVRDITENKRLQNQLWHTSQSDKLTALPNRDWLLERFPAKYQKMLVHGDQMALLYLDIDGFKAMNSTIGHAAGNELLRAVATRLKSLLRPGDEIVRVGGDEFAIVLYSVEREDVDIVARRLLQQMEMPFRLKDDSQHRVSISIGISRSPADGDNIEKLMELAVVALYEAKANGRAQHQFFERRLMDSMLRRVECEKLLRAAIEKDQFVIYFQPRVDTDSGEVVSMEALVRLNHPELGLIQPSEFIAVAEATGLILKLGEIVIMKACQQMDEWRRAGVPVVPVSVNVSAAQFAQGVVRECVETNMARFEIPAELLELELTESCMMGDQDHVAHELAAIHDLGIKLLVDDFGTGYSSLSQLQRLNLDVLKIDRSFTEQLLCGQKSEVFFQAMVTMAESLRMRVVAEGVESMEQVQILKRLHCTEIQGYLVSTPVNAARMAEMLWKRILLPLPLRAVPKLM